MDYYGDLGIFLYLIPIIFAFAFGLALLTKRNRTIPQIYLGVSFIVIATAMSISFWIDRYVKDDHSTMRPGNLIVTVWCIVSVYFYFDSLMREELHSRKQIVRSVLATTCYSLLIYVFSRFVHDDSRAIAAILNTLIEICGVIVLLMTYKKYSRFIQNQFSYNEDINLKWIVWMLILFIVFGISDNLWVFTNTVTTKILINLSLLAVIIPLFILGFRQRETPLISEVTPTDEPAGNEELASADSKFTGKEADLLAYFEKKTPFLNPDLSLTAVAAELGINHTYLSRIINSRFNVNFYTFVNNYRINHAIEMMNREQTIKSDVIYMESGFKSRSVFFKLFRERTGQTPQEYIKRKSSRETR